MMLINDVMCIIPLQVRLRAQIYAQKTSYGVIKIEKDKRIPHNIINFGL